MPRTPDLVARQRLLDDVIGYLAHNGFGDVSFRPLAKALGTSTNRLVHHFGSRDAMLEAALTRLIERHREIEAGWVRRRPDMSQTAILRRWWRWMLASPEHLAEVRLNLEAATVITERTGLSPSTRADQIGTWRDNIERRFVAAGMPPALARTEATLLKGAFSGLTLDLQASGDRRRLTRALYQLLDEVDAKLAAATLAARRR